MLKRYISLYYASIGLKEAVLLFWYLIKMPFTSGSKSRMKLSLKVSESFRNAEVYPFSTARGALSASLRIMGLKEGDEVLLSSFTCLAVPTAVIAAGCIPKYVDIDSNTLNSTTEQVLKGITGKTKAIVIQHTFGNPADVFTLKKALIDRNIFLIEDCALSAGSMINGQPVGSFGDTSFYSLELSKTLSVGWGGMLIVNRQDLQKPCQEFYNMVPVHGALRIMKDVLQTSISAICHKPEIHSFGKYIIFVLFKIGLFRYSNVEDETKLLFKNGFLFKLAGPFALLARHQWKRLLEVSHGCQNNYTELRTILEARNIQVLDNPSINGMTSSGMVASRISFLVKDRQKFMAFFNKNGIELGAWFDGPLTPYPEMGSFLYDRDDYPNAKKVASEIVNFPSHIRIELRDIRTIEKTLDDVFKNELIEIE